MSLTHKERVLAIVRGLWLDKPCYGVLGAYGGMGGRGHKDPADIYIDFQKVNNFDFINYKIDGMNVTEGDAAYVKLINEYFDGNVPVIVTVSSPFANVVKKAGETAVENLNKVLLYGSEEKWCNELTAMEENCLVLLEAFADAGAAGFCYDVRIPRGLEKASFEKYEKMVSVRLLDAVREKTYFNILHVCNEGPGGYEWFQDYPVDAIAWDGCDFAELRKVSDKVLVKDLEQQFACGNVIYNHVKDAVEQGGNKVMVTSSDGWNIGSQQQFSIWHDTMEKTAVDRLMARL